MTGTTRGTDSETMVPTDSEVMVPANGALKAILERAECEAVEKVLARADGSVAEAAATLGILRTSLYRIMKRCGIAATTRSRGESHV